MNRTNELTNETTTQTLDQTLEQPETGPHKKRGAIGKGLIAFLLTGSLGTALLVYLVFLMLGR
ncbi:MAG TPA: hypothetical protein PK402_06440 [Tepidisphaeraceae bacterium]|nr:hypothetical protein [Tepidisphaeraceae bacterium]